MIDIAPRNLVNIELGINFPKAETLEKILLALNITMEKMFEIDHLSSDEELMDEIYLMLNSIRNDRYTLEKVYRMLKIFTNKV